MRGLIRRAAVVVMSGPAAAVASADTLNHAILGIGNNVYNKIPDDIFNQC